MGLAATKKIVRCFSIKKTVTSAATEKQLLENMRKFGSDAKKSCRPQ